MQNITQSKELGELRESVRTETSDCQVTRGALRRREAAAYLGISITTLWRLTESGNIRKTSVGVYPVRELDRWLKKECP